MWLQTVKFIVKGSKRASLAQEVGFSTPNSSTLLWLVQRATELCISKNEYNELDLTKVSISNCSIITVGPGGFLLVVPNVHAVPGSYGVGQQ
jgi:hypothetical protein